MGRARQGVVCIVSVTHGPRAMACARAYVLLTRTGLTVTYPSQHTPRSTASVVQEIANSVWGAARLAHYDPRVMDRVAEHVVACRWARVCISFCQCGLGWRAANLRPMGTRWCAATPRQPMAQTATCNS